MDSADESIVQHSSSLWQDDDEDGLSSHHLLEFHTPSLSRLSTCSSYLPGHDLDNYDGGIKTTLSIESFDADEEFSDGKYIRHEDFLRDSWFSDDDDDDDDDGDKDPSSAAYSLPATPRYRSDVFGTLEIGVNSKQYASENDAEKHIKQRSEKMRMKTRRQPRRNRRLIRMEKWEDREATANWDDHIIKKDDEYDDSVTIKTEMSGVGGGWNRSFSGESESGGGGGGLRVITRPKGGKRSLCMDLEEVKACRDLGFELEHQRMFDMTIQSRLSLSASTLDTTTTSSGGSSPIPNWQISSPGDDPRDVKARLKVWAQVVALASTYRQGGC